jgi:hypothetical protein
VGSIETEKSERVRDARARTTETTRHELLGHTGALQETLVSGGLFHGIEVFTLEVLDEGQLEGLVTGDLPNDDRDGFEPETGGGSKASFSRDQDVVIAMLADDQRLNHAVLSDALTELFKGLVVEVLAGLLGVRRDSTQGAQEVVVVDLAEPRSGDQGIEASTERVAWNSH